MARGKFVDLTGKKFNKLTVLYKIGSNNENQIEWFCKCDCGNTKIVTSYLLTSGKRQSCGCQHKERVAKAARLNNKKCVTHGETHTRLYNIWHSMKSRCNNPNDKAYKWYGGRGIRICNEWNNSYVAFRNWSIENGYSDNLTLDRKDNNGDYEPSNCRWATRLEQANNTRFNRCITYKNQTKTLAEWARELEYPRYILSNRLAIGWSVERAFETPIKKR